MIPPRAVNLYTRKHWKLQFQQILDPPLCHVLCVKSVRSCTAIVQDLATIPQTKLLTKKTLKHKENRKEYQFAFQTIYNSPSMLYRTRTSQMLLVKRIFISNSKFNVPDTVSYYLHLNCFFAKPATSLKRCHLMRTVRDSNRILCCRIIFTEQCVLRQGSVCEEDGVRAAALFHQAMQPLVRLNERLVQDPDRELHQRGMKMRAHALIPRCRQQKAET